MNGWGRGFGGSSGADVLQAVRNRFDGNQIRGVVQSGNERGIRVALALRFVHRSTHVCVQCDHPVRYDVLVREMRSVDRQRAGAGWDRSVKAASSGRTVSGRWGSCQW